MKRKKRKLPAILCCILFTVLLIIYFGYFALINADMVQGPMNLWEYSCWLFDRATPELYSESVLIQAMEDSFGANFRVTEQKTTGFGKRTYTMIPDFDPELRIRVTTWHGDYNMDGGGIIGTQAYAKNNYPYCLLDRYMDASKKTAEKHGFDLFRYNEYSYGIIEKGYEDLPRAAECAQELNTLIPLYPYSPPRIPEYTDSPYTIPFFSKNSKIRLSMFVSDGTEAKSNLRFVSVYFNGGKPVDGLLEELQSSYNSCRKNNSEPNTKISQ